MGKHRHPDRHETQTLSGVVRQHNFSPKGDIEGVVLDTDAGPVQVNFPHGPHAAAVDSMLPGSTVYLVVGEGHHDHGDHPVHEFVSRLDGDEPSRPARDREPRAEGLVVRLNYARHGEPNGVVLDTGDFVHLKPHGMALVTLAIGDRVVAVGSVKPTVDGHRVIEATVVNGVSISHGPHHG